MDSGAAVPEAPDQFSRQTSFARSFFQANATPEVLNLTAVKDEDEIDNNGDNMMEDDQYAQAKPPPAYSLKKPPPFSPGDSDDDRAYMPTKPPPPPRNLRRRSSLARFRSTRSMGLPDKSSVTSNSGTTAAAAAIVASMNESFSSHEDDRFPLKRPPEDNYTPYKKPPEEYLKSPPPEVQKQPPQPERIPLDRQPSWYRDALEQGVGLSEDMLAALGLPPSVLEDVGGASEPKNAGLDQSLAGHFDYDEVMEQYRIMAQLNAQQLFREKTGCDLEEYIDQHQNCSRKPSGKSSSIKGDEQRPGSNEMDLSSIPLHIPKGEWNVTVFRERFLPTLKDRKILKPDLPPLAELLAERRGNNESVQVKELTMGKLIARGASNAGILRTSSSTTIRCSGCANQLQVDLNVALVVCPSCSAVSPNDATRL